MDEDRWAHGVVKTLPDGRMFIPATAVVDKPALREIIALMSNYWQLSPILDGWVGPTEETS